ncbi:MAG: Hsp20/alpha crystallin family protein [Ignavibacteria bacterium]|nr:MAG: Hsp20/alpha crystallin family protein [Ignavibacteria bacterium]
MTLVRFEPLRELEDFSSQIQKYFDELPFMFSGRVESFTPKFDIYEDNENLYVDVEIPGMKKEELKLTLEDNILTLEGEKKVSEDLKNKKFYRNERMFGSFKRSFTLPVEVDNEKIEAKYDNGVLNIKFHKLDAQPKNERTIEVQ